MKIMKRLDSGSHYFGYSNYTLSSIKKKNVNNLFEDKISQIIKFIYIGHMRNNLVFLSIHYFKRIKLSDFYLVIV